MADCLNGCAARITQDCSKAVPPLFFPLPKPLYYEDEQHRTCEKHVYRFQHAQCILQVLTTTLTSSGEEHKGDMRQRHEFELHKETG